LGLSCPLLGRSCALLGRSWDALGRSWAAIGPFLACSWALLVRSWPLLGLSCPVVGRSCVLVARSWDALGRSWAALGPLLCALWPLLGRKVALAQTGRRSGQGSRPQSGPGPSGKSPKRGRGARGLRSPLRNFSSFQHTGLAVVLQGLVRPRLRGTELEFWRNSEEARTDRPSQQLRSLNGEWRLMRYFLLTHLCGISHRIWCTLSTICSDAA
jgi:hypothetical protein